MKHSRHLSSASNLFALACVTSITLHASAQVEGDYRSAGTGNWNTATTWERYDGADFVAATIVPTSTDGVITIRTGHTVTASTFFTADQVVVESGGTLNHTNGGFTVADGTGDDIQVFGTLIHSGNSFSGPGNIRIRSGATFQWTGGGQLNPDLVLDLDQGSTASSNSTSALLNNATINNAGTWTLVNGGFSSTALPGLFHNLGDGIVELNGWASNTNSWAQSTINDGVINKNNGSTTFTFRGRGVTNNGTINVPQGELVMSNSTGTNSNAGTYAFGGAGTTFRIDASFTNTQGGNITGLEHLQLQSNTFTTEAGSSMNTLDLLTVPTFSTLVIGQDIIAEEVNFTGGAINGAAQLRITPGGSFNWTGGNFNATLDVGVGGIAIFNAPSSSPNLNNGGTINNAGTWNMEGGNLSQLGTVGSFNNGATGVVNLNNWQSTTNSWKQNTVNHGIINKNNGAVQFSISLPMTNEATGTLNVNSGTLRFSSSALLRGTVNVPAGSAITGNSSGVLCEGVTFENDGSVAPILTFQGTAPQILNGTGTLEDLRMNGTGTVSLGGTQTVTDVLTFTMGLLDLGDHDLVLTSAASSAVVGGNENSYARTSGNGSLIRPVNGSNYAFPVGGSTYTPLSISLVTGPQDNFAARVQNGVSSEYDAPGVAAGGMATSDVVDRTWVVSEEVAGGNSATIALQWNAADELPLFERTACSVANYNGTDWSIGTLAAATGDGPFTRNVSGLTSFRELCVADEDASLNDIGTGLTDAGPAMFHVHPNPASHTLFINGAGIQAGTTILEFTDAAGRSASHPITLQGNIATVDVNDIPNGSYLLRTLDRLGRTQVARVSIVH